MNYHTMKAAFALLVCSVPSLLRAAPIFIEAESFISQTFAETRQWQIFSSQASPLIKPDGDPVHFPGASGGSYIELLPDSRRSHDDKLVKGENFTNEGGKMAALSYKVTLPEAGRYYVWARAYSTTTEDNGLHFGLDGNWPESGARWQTVQKNDWHWDCKQRTETVHTGVPMQLWLDVEKAGEHMFHMSMREDGIEVDQLALSTDVNWRPDGFKGYALAEQTSTANPVVRQPDGKGEVVITGELKQWHKVTLTLDGPFAYERDSQPNAFTDFAFEVMFTHESGSPSYKVPGYFATDGNAAESGAESGTKWRAHLSPDQTGTWNYRLSFTKGRNAALDGGGDALKPFDGVSGTFQVNASDKTGRDFRSKGHLRYVGKHHLQFAGSKEFFLKAGPDSPETLLAYTDFDGTEAHKSNVPLKTWAPHLGDWKSGDPIWRNDKGKALIGALNYLAGKGVNVFSFLTYNAAGDGDNVWPFITRNAKLNYDCSKLDQWGIVFDHATSIGLYLHFKLQENESDDERIGGPKRTPKKLPEALDGGKLGIERKLYCRELIARFGHSLAMNWNIGEENTQSSQEVRDMVKYIHDTDPYKHHTVLHTFPPEQQRVYTPLLGDNSLLTGVSLQNSWKDAHEKTLNWIRESAKVGRPWIVANDEQNPAGLGVPPDPGYKGHDGTAVENDTKGSKAEGFTSSKPYTLHDIRKLCLWGNLMAGGAGVEYYFGYKLPENDLVCEDFRSRDKSWDYCRIALDIFSKIPFAEMRNANFLIGNMKNDNTKFCLAKAGELYLVYLPNGGSTDLDLTAAKGLFTVIWFNPRDGGNQKISVKTHSGGDEVNLTAPDENDWLAIIRQN